jgi:hypothetical protein
LETTVDISSGKWRIEVAIIDFDIFLNRSIRRHLVLVYYFLILSENGDDFFDFWSNEPLFCSTNSDSIGKHCSEVEWSSFNF